MQRLITKQRAAELVGYHPEHLMRLVRAGMFPRPIKLGAGRGASTRFVIEEIEAWIERKMAERPTGPDVSGEQVAR
jgi:predicted DNA-binding transcriptional regulator AlpA